MDRRAGAAESFHQTIWSGLRCPDCAGGAAERTGENAFQCCNCGRVLELSGNVLRAVPTELVTGAQDNLAYYDELAQAPASFMTQRLTSRNHARKMRMVMDALGLSAGRAAIRVLEIGMGFGSHGDVLAEAGCDYVGLDISEGNLLRARQLYPRLGEQILVSGDAERLPFQDGLFEAGLYVAALHHVPNPERGVSEMMRVIAPGGRFCILEPRRFYPVHFVNVLLNIRTEISALKMRADKIHKWVQEGGAAKVEISCCVFTPNRPVWLHPVYDRIDAFLEHTPPLHGLSVMFCVHGVR